MAKVLVLGGSYLQSKFIKDSLNLGHEVHFADMDVLCYSRNVKGANFHHIDISNYRGLKELCEKIIPDCIVPPVNELGNIMAAKLADEFCLVYNSTETVLTTQDKQKIKEVLVTTELPVPKVFEPTDNVFKRLSFPLIVKPTNSTSSKGVTLVHDNYEIPNAIETAWNYVKKGGTVILEEFIEGEQYSIETISQDGKHYVAGITYEQLSEPPYFFERIDTCSPNIDAESRTMLTPYINKLLDALQVKVGPCHVEVRIKDGKIYLIDFATRSGGWRDILLHHAKGTEYNKLILNSYLGQQIDIVEMTPPEREANAYILNYAEDMLTFIEAQKEGLIKEEYFYGKAPQVIPKSLADAYGYYFV